MKRVLFFLRHFNDIDNVAPAIHYLLEDEPSLSVDIVLYHEDHTADGDPNLEMLTRVHGQRCQVRHIGELYGFAPGGPQGARRDATYILQMIGVLRRVNPSLSQSLQTTYLKLGRSLRSRFRRGDAGRSYDVAAIRKGLADPAAIRRGLSRLVSEEPTPHLAVFDVNRTSQVQGLVDGLRALGVTRIVCLPVSPLINVNVLRAKKHVDVWTPKFAERHDYRDFDAVGFVERSWVDNYARIMPLIGLEDHLSDRVTVLGSIRYCQPWLEARSRLLTAGGSTAAQTLPERLERPRLALLLSNAHSNADDAEVERAFELLAQFPAYDVVVKGHTRAAGRRGDYPAVHIRSADAVSTSDLIEWADAVLFWGTSAAIEGYQRGRFMVCLAYLSSNVNLYEVHDAGYVARSRDDLLEFLIRFDEDRESLRYNHQGAQRFIDEVVENRASGRSVPQAYVDFLHQQAALAEEQASP